MTALRMLWAVCFAVALSGCASIGPAVTMRAADIKPARLCPNGVAASGPIDSTGYPTSCTSGSNLDRVHQLVQDSQQKCGEFVVGMFEYQAKTSTSLDIASTTFNALTTVFTRVGIKNSLAAGSAIATGSKNAIHTEYLNSLTIANIVQAVQSTYDTAVSEYLTYLDGQSSIDVEAQRSHIMAIHKLCSLPAAEGTIQASVAPPKPKSGTGSQLSFTYTVQDRTIDINTDAVAQHIAEGINQESAFKAADIVATQKPAAKNQIEFASSSGKWATLSWKAPEVVGVTDTAGGTTPATIRATFAQNSSPLTIDGTVTPRETITIKTDVMSQASPSTPSPPLAAPAPASKKVSFTYTVQPGDSPTSIATHFVNAFNADKAIQAADLAAAPSPHASSDVVFYSPGMKWNSIKWTKDPAISSGHPVPGLSAKLDPNRSVLQLKGKIVPGESVTISTDSPSSLAVMAPAPWTWATTTELRAPLLVAPPKPPAPVSGRAAHDNNR